MLSIVIIVDHHLIHLDNLISVIIKQAVKIGNFHIIIANKLIKNKILFKTILTKYKQQNISIKIIEISNSKNIFSDIKNKIEGDFLIFTKTDVTPDKNWLQYLVTAFSNPHLNLIAGQIVDDFSNKIITQKIKEKFHSKQVNYFDKWQEQIANLAIRTEFLKQNTAIDLVQINSHEINFYYRILRELEYEITYLPNAIVKKNT